MLHANADHDYVEMMGKKKWSRFTKCVTFNWKQVQVISESLLMIDLFVLLK